MSMQVGERFLRSILCASFLHVIFVSWNAVDTLYSVSAFVDTVLSFVRGWN